ncbi:MAG: hypothetical protein FI736_02800 [SAR202 cluster bacterium]|nr:hypothetical protein [SAR202 cluster bacterium]|tara:strand:+ start:260 stop:787 length:528 start_codon:yes stop_codon:yes gene_type:complete
MDLVVIAQIITGFATLSVAFVLVFQLRKQNEQLSLQHRDAERNLIISIREIASSRGSAIASNPEWQEINYRGLHDFDALENQLERVQFYTSFTHQIHLHNLQTMYSDLLEIDAEKNLKNWFAVFPGTRKFYKESMIRYELPERFVKLCDDFIREIESEVGEKGQKTELLRSDIDN